MPLEYGGRLIDPLFPVLRVVSILLVLLGSCSLIGTSATLTQVGSGFFARTSLYSGWTFVLQIPVAIIEIIAGSINARRLSSPSWLWAWVWCVIGMQLFRTVFMLIVALIPPPTYHSGYSTRLAIELAGQAAQMISGSGLALCVMTMLVYRRRMMTAA
jgi:hypothetical protein